MSNEQANFDNPSDTQEPVGAEHIRDKAIEQAMLNARIDITHAQLLERSNLAGSELALEARIRARDSFGVLVELTYERSFTVAYSHTKLGSKTDSECRERAQDVVQEAYERAYKYLPKFKGESKFETWFYRVIKNREHTHSLHEKRHSHSDIADIEVSTSVFLGSEEDLSPELAMAQHDAREPVLGALGVLSRKDRELVFLKSSLDMSYEEIAELRGKKSDANSLKTRHHRAIKKMREFLVEQGITSSGT